MDQLERAICDACRFADWSPSCLGSDAGDTLELGQRYTVELRDVIIPLGELEEPISVDVA